MGLNLVKKKYKFKYNVTYLIFYCIVSETRIINVI